LNKNYLFRILKHSGQVLNLDYKYDD